MGRCNARNGIGFSLLGAALVWTVPASAQTVWDSLPLPRSNWSTFASAAHSDNVTRLAGGPSDTVLTVGASGAFFRDQGRFRANVRGSLWVEDYTRNTFDTDVLGAASAALSYQFVPDRFEWHLDDTYAETTRNTLQAASAANRSAVNSVSTGPQFNFAFGSKSGLRLSGRYELNSFEDPSQLDDRRTRGQASLYRRMSASTIGSLEGSYTKTKFRDGSLQLGTGTFADTYETTEVFGRIDLRRSRYGLSADAGAARITQLNATETAPLVRLNLYRRLTPTLSLNAAAGQEFRSEIDALRGSVGSARVVNGQVVFDPLSPGTGAPGNGIVDLNAQNQPTRFRFARAALDLTRPRTSLTLSAGRSSERFQFSGRGFDRDSFDAGLNASRRLRPNVTVTLTASYTDRKFTTLDQGDQEVSGGLRLSWQVSRMSTVSAGYRYSKRTSDFAASAFAENVAFVGFTYGTATGGAFTGNYSASAADDFGSTISRRLALR